MKKSLLILGIISMFITENAVSQNSIQLQDWIFAQREHTKKDIITPKALISRPSKSKNFMWNSTTNDWDYADSTYYSYNSQGYETEYMSSKNGNKQFKKTTSYNSKNQKTEELNQNYNSSTSSFVNSWRNRSEYDLNFNETASYHENWNTTTSSFDLSSSDKTIYTYNANNQMTEQIDMDYDLATTTYLNSGKTTYLYSGNNIIEIEGFDWNGTSWVQAYKLIYEYANNMLVSIASKAWDGTQYVYFDKIAQMTWDVWNTSWEDSDLSSYTIEEWNGSALVTTTRTSIVYGNYRSSVETTESFENGSWVLSGRFTNAIDSHFNNYMDKEEKYINNAWVTNYETEEIYTYDVDDNITQLINKNWDSSLLTTVNQQRRDFADFQIYSNTVGTENVTINSSLYPNPFNNSCIITVENEGNYTFNLFNLKGQKVRELTFNSNLTLNKDELNEGMYFYTISNDKNNLKTGKLVIQ